MKIILGVLLVLGIFFGAYVGFIILQKNINASRAEVMSEKYVANLYSEYSIVGKNCQGEDTNQDNYISCDVRIKIGNDAATEKVVQLSCPTFIQSYLGNTCKESRLQLAE